MAEKDQAWHGLDAEAGRNDALGLGVHFSEDYLPLKSRRGLGKGRGHHLARPAPRSPEIDEHGQCGTGDEALERLVGEIHGVGGQKGSRALGADRVLAQAVGEYGVDGLAAWADGVYFFHEGEPPVCGKVENVLGVNIPERWARWRGRNGGRQHGTRPAVGMALDPAGTPSAAS